MGDQTPVKSLEELAYSIRRFTNPETDYRRSKIMALEKKEDSLKAVLASLDEETYKSVVRILEERHENERVAEIAAALGIDPEDRQAYLTGILELADKGKIEEGKLLVKRVPVPVEHTASEEAPEPYMIAADIANTTQDATGLRRAALEIMLAEADPYEREDFIQAYADKRSHRILAALQDPGRSAKIAECKKTAAGIAKGIGYEIYFTVFAVSGIRRPLMMIKAFQA